MNKLFSILLIGALVCCSSAIFASSLNNDLLEADTSKIATLLQQIEHLEEQPEHCEVPCGIYGDSLRVALISEHIRTIEKASTQIEKMSSQDKPNYNQLVRWVMNKEKHAEEIQHIVSQYFLHQRIKPVEMTSKGKHGKYLQQLKNLHHILVMAMKTKQSTDASHITNLKAALEAFEDSYFHSH